MYLLVADETNRSASASAKFLIYGGLIVPMAALPDLSVAIEGIRSRYGYRPQDEFKFDTRSRPDSVSPTAAKDAKKDVVAVCGQMNCRFVAQVSLHALIMHRTPEEQLEFAINTILLAFNQFLIREEAHGLCLIDNFPSKRQWAFLANKFSTGLTFGAGKSRRLDRIHAYGATCAGAGHVNSVMDIVLGSFRYCVNESANDDAARDMLRAVMPLMLSAQGQDGRITGYGLLLRPKSINAPAHKREYDSLVKRLNELATGRTAAE
jgi:hypothetical protein